MPYKITNITIKASAEVPDFDEWLARVDTSELLADIVDDGKSAQEVISESVATFSNPENGFISSSSRVSDDGLTWTWESIWESKEAFLLAQTQSTFIRTDEPATDRHGNIDDDGNGTVFYKSKETANSRLIRLYQEEYADQFTHQTFEANI